MASRLSATSYALLGLLDLAPFSAYELARYMQTSALSMLWPRASASLYREPKNLVAHGLATATVERREGRRRTVYQITPAGREALAAWLAEEGEGLVLQCEAAVKAFFGGATDVASLRRQLERLASDARRLEDYRRSAAPAWLEGELPFPQRIHYSAMCGGLIFRLHATLGEWAEEWLARTEHWETTRLDTTTERDAREEITSWSRSG